MRESFLRASDRIRFLIVEDSQRDHTLLEQRLLAMEQKLLSLEQAKRCDQPSPQSSRSIEVHTSTSPTQGDQRSETTMGLTGSPDQDDVVDGMGAVALKDGAAEEEYFGENCPQSLQDLVFELNLTLSDGYDGKGPPPTWRSCDLSSVALGSR